MSQRLYCSDVLKTWSIRIFLRPLLEEQTLVNAWYMLRHSQRASMHQPLVELRNPSIPFLGKRLNTQDRTKCIGSLLSKSVIIHPLEQPGPNPQNGPTM